MPGGRTAAGLLAAGLAAVSAEMAEGAAALAGSSLVKVGRRRAPQNAWPSIGATKPTTTTVARRLHSTAVKPASLHATRNVPSFPIFNNGVYEANLPAGHRFPMDKYRRVRERDQERLGNGESPERSTGAGSGEVRTSFHVSPLATVDELTPAHCPSYVNRFLTGDQTEDEIRPVGLSLRVAMGSTVPSVALAERLQQPGRFVRRSARGESEEESLSRTRREGPGGKGRATGPSHRPGRPTLQVGRILRSEIWGGVWRLL
uniref:Uncharacterized protein n=1 Tax=Odontella aurita TaxID=265563 RepID=A0A6U6FVA6_9STRA|mmetsp:Transcript_38210/g.114330  ORF Transcript_38210/g.114330 Transcript_38210/m.114330 type:complete len:260 (-) Transcript_38210:348-1127(-)